MSGDACGSITMIIKGIRGGDKSKATPLWGRYFERLTRAAAGRLRCGPTAARGNEEDVALSAINSFCNGLAEGKFPYVDRREVLWGTLAKIVERKALRLLNDRRWKNEVVFSDLRPDASAVGGADDQFAVVEPSAEYIELVRLELKELIDAVENPLRREALRMVMEDYTVPEIAAKLNRSRRGVYVWFRTIGEIWEEDVGRENFFG